MTEKKRNSGAAGESGPAGAAEETAITKAVAADEAKTAAEQPTVADAATAQGATAAEAATEPDKTAVTSAGGIAAGTTQTVVVHKHGRLRSILVGFLVLLSCLALIVTGVTVWTHYTVLNTNGYMKLVGPVGKDPQAIKAISGYVAGQVVAASDLQGRAQAALPPKAAFLAGPITSAVQSFIDKQTTKVLSTPQAYNVWLGINRVTHQQLVGLLRGQNNYTYIQGSDVKLNLLPLVSQALVWLDGKLPGALSSRFSPPVIQPGTPASDSIQQVSQWAGKALPADFGQVTLLKNNALGPAQKAVKLFDGLVIALPIILAVLIAGTILLSRRRRYTVMALGIGGAIALIVTYVIIKRASAAIVGSLQLGSVNEVVRNVVTASLRPLATITVWVVVIGAIVAVVAWLVGRKDVQTVIVDTGRKVVEAQGSALGSSSATVRWIARHIQLLRVVGLVAGLILLVIAASSSWLAIAFALLLTLLYEGLLSLLVGEWPFSHEEAGPSGADAGTPA
ncbi:MAG TPA: hypothetical protein VFD50_06120 [Thermoleophilia bacterium]|nr:hypothetical protein [Thermoleophilia bacterium]